MAKETIAFRVEKEIIEKIDALAESQGTNRSAVAEMALTTFAGFDDEFIKMMIDRTVSLHIPLYVAIQNTIIAQSARILAKDKVFGGMVHTSEEFPIIKDESGWHMLTGKALEEYLIDLYVKEFEQAEKD